jgi:hypothetical protein
MLRAAGTSSQINFNILSSKPDSWRERGKGGKTGETGEELDFFNYFKHLRYSHRSP